MAAIDRSAPRGLSVMHPAEVRCAFRFGGGGRGAM